MLIQTQKQLDAAMKDIGAAPVLGLDAEMDSYYSYYPKLCLIQCSTPKADYLIDPLEDLDFRQLAATLGDERHIKVLHAAENDIPYLKERLHCDFHGLFDTHLAAKILQLPKSGLAPLLEEYFQVTLDKRFQTADWRQRPIPQDMAEYAKMDTRYLIELRENLLEMLQTQGLMDEAEGLFRRACQAKMQRKKFDPDGWVRLEGARKLPPHKKARLKAIYKWRNDLAEQLDSAVFRILPDGIVNALANSEARSPEDLRRQFRHGTIQRNADSLFEAIQNAGTHAVDPPRKAPLNPLTPKQQKRYETLRKWRNETAEEQKVDPDRIVSNKVLKAVVQAEPKNLKELEATGLLEPWRLERYGEKLLDR